MEARRVGARRLELSLLAAALTIAGCGHTQRNGDGPSSGGASGKGAQDKPPPLEPAVAPRLLAWQLQAPGTRPLLLGIFDSLRGEHCRFLLDEQGHLRCLPLPPPTLEVAGFADPGCTQRVYSVSHVDDVLGVLRHAFAVPLPPKDCEQRYAVAGLRELGPMESHFSGTPADCRQYTPLELEPGRHELVVSNPMSPGDWANGRELDGQLVSDRLQLRQFASDRGESFPSRLVAAPWEESCALTELSDRTVCVPPALPSSTLYFGDADCQSQPLWRADACSRAVHIGTPGDLHALGEVWDGPFFSQGKVCQGPREDGLSPGDRLFLQGEAVELDALASSDWTNDGNDRLRLRGLRGGDGSFVALPDELFDSSSQRRAPFEVHASRYFDEKAGEGCAPVWTRDAGIRCVPESTAVDPYTFLMYADPDCTEPAYMCTNETCPSELVLMGYDERGEYRAVSRNRAEPLISVPIYSGAGSACQAAFASGGPPFMKAGDVLPWDGYPELTELNGLASASP